jgi:hypothetical protein
MFSKTMFSLAAALLLFGGVASAAPDDAEFSAAEAGIPDSVDYAHRVAASHAPSNEEIEALEVGNPDSVGYAERTIDSTQITAQGWLALEFSNPEIR